MLTPNNTYTLNGVTVKEKIIPDDMVWTNDTNAKKAGFEAGDLYKSCMKLSGSGTVKGITLHNTADLDGVEDDAELYTRATYNQNMGAARPHFYVDDLGAWQLLKLDEVGWHAGDGAYGQGNYTTIGIECIMTGKGSDEDIKAEDNAAKIIAYLLNKYNLSIDKLYTHTYFINKSKGYVSSVDDQNAHLISGIYKYCPLYILPHWAAFKAKVITYLDELNKTVIKPTVSRPKVEDIKPKDEMCPSNKKTESEDDEMVRYKFLKEIPNDNGFRDIINVLMDAGIIQGDGSDSTGNNDTIDLSHDQVRSLVFEYRGGSFDRKLKSVGIDPVVEVNM